MLIIITTPTIPTAFLKCYCNSLLFRQHLRNIFPTIGIKLDTAAFVVFTVSASTPFVILPSNEVTPTNTVNAIPKIHTTELFINFANLST